MFPHLHQIHRVLRVPLKKVRREISVGGAGLSVPTGIPTNHRETFLAQRLQLRSKVGPAASCGGGGWVRDLRLRAPPRCGPYLPRAPGSSRTPCFPSPARSKCRSTPFTRWRPQELQRNTPSAGATEEKPPSSYWDRTLTRLRNCFSYMHISAENPPTLMRPAGKCLQYFVPRDLFLAYFCFFHEYCTLALLIITQNSSR